MVNYIYVSDFLENQKIKIYCSKQTMYIKKNACVCFRS